MCVQFLAPPVCACVYIYIYIEMLYCRKGFMNIINIVTLLLLLLLSSSSSSSFVLGPFYSFFKLGRQPPAGHSRRTTRYDSYGRVISSSQTPLLDNTQHSQQTDIHVLVRIRTQNFNTRATTDLHFKQRDHWDRLSGPLLFDTLIDNLSNAIKHSKY